MFNHNHFVALFAVSDNNVMGGDGKMLWKHKPDFRWFKGLTTGQAVIMGRKTWESLPGDGLPNRVNIVITRNKSYRANGAVVVHSLAEAALYLSRNHPNKIQFVIGGRDLLDQAIPYCTEAYVTKIYADVDVSGVPDVVYGPEFPDRVEVDKTFTLPDTDIKINGGVKKCTSMVFHYLFKGPVKSIFQ